MTKERDRQPERASAEQEAFNPEIFERFQSAKIKIAIQKDGALTDIARQVASEKFGLEVPKKPPYKRIPLAVSDDGEFGYVYAKNKSLCDLVASGAVDLAVVGTDRIVEEYAEERVQVTEIFRDYSWPIVLATPQDSPIENLFQLQRIATQYPRTAELALQETDIGIIKTHGGTETYAYLMHYGQSIDGVVDIVESGATLRAHGLQAWEPKLCDVYPSLIVNKESNFSSNSETSRLEDLLPPNGTIFSAS